ncbi:MAG: V-type ATP synthase subunit E family protein [Promethearchaeota archaeon]
MSLPIELLKMQESVLADAKKEAKKIRRDGAARLEEIQHEYQAKIHYKLVEMEKEFEISKRTIKNRGKSESIIRQRLEIQEKKFALYRDFLEKLRIAVKKKISRDSGGYLARVKGKIVEYARRGISLPVDVFVNERDYGGLKDTRGWVPNDLQDKIQVRENSSEVPIGGFILAQQDGRMAIDWTLEKQLERLEPDIKVELGNLFPEVE